ncbi:MAG: alpha-amylase family glycosyl hydrolase [Bacteroidota bacterium]|nr:alpha-amylase family glycosyl hydrolase [Bacteroidota bacterium]
MYINKSSKEFGAWRTSDVAPSSTVKFSIFFPDNNIDATQYVKKNDQPSYGDPQIESIYVVGDFQTYLGQPHNWQVDVNNKMSKTIHAKGWVWSLTTQQLPEGFYQYKYHIVFNDGTFRVVTDPCSRYGGTDNQNSAFTVGPSVVASVTPIAHRKHLRELIIYELNIDDFTAEFLDGVAPLDAVASKLNYLKNDLGINAILFLPWTAWGDNEYSWGYTPNQYFSVEHRYTDNIITPNPSCQLSRLRDLINACHFLDIHVIMDGVFNHVSPGNVFPYQMFYKNQIDSPYIGTFGGTFSGLPDLNYNNGCVQEFVGDVCRYWIDEFKIDGIRFDNTTNFYIPNNQNGLPTLLSDIAKYVNDPNFSLTLEHIDLSAATVVNNTVATSFWHNGLYQATFESLWNNQITQNLLVHLDSHQYLNAEKVATLYLSNHDHSHVTWQCGANNTICNYNNSGSMCWYKTQPYAIAMMTAPGVPMIQNGQEFAEDHWIPENDQESNRRIKTRPIRWGYQNDKIGKEIFNVYKTLIGIRVKYLGLCSDNFYPNWASWQTQFNEEGYGIDTKSQTAIYHRWGVNLLGKTELFIVVLNFSKNDTFVDIPFPQNGNWIDILNGNQQYLVTNYKLQTQKINSNWGKILFKLSN